VHAAWARREEHASVLASKRRSCIEAEVPVNKNESKRLTKETCLVKSNIFDINIFKHVV